ncbi:MAG TPA: polyphosphate kinase 2 [Polyangiales bacterium]|nr:polyphosphate kinase 2 [Polyangiales bacterium]
MPILPRAQLFEFNDRDWVPESLRDTIVETLSRSLDWGGFLAPLAPVIDEFLSAAGTTEVLDLCAGAGGPALILSQEAERLGLDAPRYLMTDLYPRVPLWTEATRRRPRSIDFIEDPVDATRIPASISRGRARVMVNAFHHFQPEMAGAILRDAVEQEASILISESFERDPRGAFPMIPIGIPALLATPLLSPRNRLAKAAWTWLTPIALAAGAWDAIISTLRIYSESDLRDLVAPFGHGYRWKYGTYDYPFGGRGCYFQGVPAAAQPVSPGKPADGLRTFPRKPNGPSALTDRMTMDDEKTYQDTDGQRPGDGDATIAREANARRAELAAELKQEVDALEEPSGPQTDARTAEAMRKKALRRYLEEQSLRPYQAELIKMQRYLEESGTRMIILFEGRDAAGKGGTIRRVTRYMNEKHYRVVALGKPTERERTEWFFQKYVQHFPRAGEVVLFDRSWYNRAMVEPVFGFCTDREYKNFMRGVTGFEKDLVRQGTVLIKLYFSVTKDEQNRRFERRKADPLRQWKLSEVDVQAQERWDDFTNVKYEMLKRTHTTHAPWKIIRSNDKHAARLNALKLILNSVPYERLDESLDFVPSSEIVISGARELEKMEAQRLRSGKFLV